MKSNMLRGFILGSATISILSVSEEDSFSPFCSDSSPGLAGRTRFLCFFPGEPARARAVGNIGCAQRLVEVPLVQVLARQHAGSAWYSAKIKVTIDNSIGVGV